MKAASKATLIIAGTVFLVGAGVSALNAHAEPLVGCGGGACSNNGIGGSCGWGSDVRGGTVCACFGYWDGSSLGKANCRPTY